VRPMHLVTDVDGVILDWWQGFAQWMKQAGYEANEEEPSNYRLGKTFGMPEETIMDLVQAFNEDAPESGNLTYLNNDTQIPTILKQLRDMDFKLSIVTKFSDNPRAIEKRKENLYKLFGDVFDEVHIISLYGCKEPVLRRLRQAEDRTNAFWWIEDNVDNAHIGLNLGYRTMLMHQSHNKDVRGPRSIDNRIKKVKNWNDILTDVLEVY